MGINIWRSKTKKNMKLFLPIFIGVLNAEQGDDKRIPPKHPLDRLDQLERFAKEWLATGFGMNHNKAIHWSGKFDRNTQRMRDRFEHCGSNPGSNRKRREAKKGGNNGLGFARLDTANPVKALKQITTGYRKWAERFLQDCKVQPERQAERSRKWNVVLRQRYEDHKMKMSQI